MSKLGQATAPRPIPTEGHRRLEWFVARMPRRELAKKLGVSPQNTRYVLQLGNAPSKKMGKRIDDVFGIGYGLFFVPPMSRASWEPPEAEAHLALRAIAPGSVEAPYEGRVASPATEAVTPFPVKQRVVVEAPTDVSLDEDDDL